jgi:hypothetical protein
VVTIGVMGTTVINYSVTNTNGCVSVATTNFIVSNLPMLQPITGGNGVCVGATNQLSNATSLPTNTTASWSSIAGRATVSSIGLVTGTSAGNATIKYTITNTYGCSSYNTKMVSVNATPTMPVIVYAPNTANANYCTNKIFTLVGNPIGGVWSSTGVITITNPNGTVNTGNVVGIGSVTYTYTNNKGCNNSRTIIGTIVTCASRGIVNEKQETSGYFVMYPNPAKTFISLKINLLFGAATIVITDLYGKEVKRQVVNGKLQVVNVEDLSKGIYFVSVVTIEGKITEKLVVN